MTLNGCYETSSSLFYKFLEIITNLLSDGTRFRCVATSSFPCPSCLVLQKLLSTYVDLTTYQEIVNQRVTHNLCGFLFCNQPLNRENNGDSSRRDSTYKIDLVTRRIYNRKVFYSFCSTSCIDKSDRMEGIIANSPMENGTITPMVIRKARRESIQKLHSIVARLRACGSEDGSGVSDESIDLKDEGDDLDLIENLMTFRITESAPPQRGKGEDADGLGQDLTDETKSTESGVSGASGTPLQSIYKACGSSKVRDPSTKKRVYFAESV